MLTQLCDYATASCLFRSGTIGRPPLLAYGWPMARTNADIDNAACAVEMRRYHLWTKREAINFAPRALGAELLGVEEARRLRGSGREGDLETLRTSRVT